MTVAENIVDFMNDRETNEIFSIENTLKHTYMDIGREEGEELGEKNKQLEIARNLLKENMKISIISKVTGLSIEAIQELQKN